MTVTLIITVILESYQESKTWHFGVEILTFIFQSIFYL